MDIRDPKLVLSMARTVWPHSPVWWEREAARAVGLGHFAVITGRSDDRLYLLRTWMTTPKMSEDERWDSQESVLLHFFARGDTDLACHSHPWPFRTTVLCGGYDEHLPPVNWSPGSELGPAYDQNIIWRGPGETVEHSVKDLHLVGRTVPGTFTLVRTGERVQDWGFHPHGKPFVPWKTFLGIAP